MKRKPPFDKYYRLEKILYRKEPGEILTMNKSKPIILVLLLLIPGSSFIATTKLNFHTMNEGNKVGNPFQAVEGKWIGTKVECLVPRHQCIGISDLPISIGSEFR